MRPFIGAILGALMFMAVQFGAVAATKTTINQQQVPLLLAALAGFSWEWSIGVLKNVEKLFQTTSDSTTSQ
jgi:hypothetical protein